MSLNQYTQEALQNSMPKVEKNSLLVLMEMLENRAITAIHQLEEGLDPQNKSVLTITWEDSRIYYVYLVRMLNPNPSMCKLTTDSIDCDWRTVGQIHSENSGVTDQHLWPKSQFNHPYIEGVSSFFIPLRPLDYEDLPMPWGVVVFQEQIGEDKQNYLNLIAQ